MKCLMLKSPNLLFFFPNTAYLLLRLGAHFVALRIDIPYFKLFDR